MMGATTLTGKDICNRDGQQPVGVDGFMINTACCAITCAVWPFGGLPGVGDERFAVPWSALFLEAFHKRFTFNARTASRTARLTEALRFDKDDGPPMADETPASGVFNFHGKPSG